jgi:carbamoyltransferase
VEGDVFLVRAEKREHIFMGKTILGISAFYHDSAAAIVSDGRLVAAAQEERFTRIKHDYQFPVHAVDYCLREAGVSPAGLDYVVFYDKPLLKFERLLETYLAFAPFGLKSFLSAMPLWLKTKLHLPREIRKALRGEYSGPLVFTSHHESHAASAFFPSPFEDAAILTMDGVGEWDTASIGHGRGNKIELLQTQQFPHSLGLLYSAFTYFTGFKVNSGEYKLMGLAPYGEPRFTSLILDKLIDLRPDGSLAMDMSYFSYCQGLTMTNKKFADLFGGPPRKQEDTITQREMDIAASIQKVTEQAVLNMARHARALTGSPNLCLAGGVALNCVANGVLLREKIFDQIWIQPAAGDAGGALGAALFAQYHLLENKRVVTPGMDLMQGSMLGNAFTGDEVCAALDKAGLKYHQTGDEAAYLQRVAQAIAAGKVVGWFQGRMEFGPRALGGRSILGDPRSPEMQATMNLRIKFRESFRPFAPSVLVEDVGDYFELDTSSPYMLLVAGVKKERCHPLSAEQEAAMRDPDLCKRVNVPRSDIPAVTHVDLSARVQTVAERDNPKYYRLLRAFKALTGCGVLINTSFNVRGEPIVGSPEDAIRCLMATDMDVLAIEDCLVFKEEQTHIPAADRQRYLQEFKLD